MKEYHKIETLYKFNQETKKFDIGNFYNKSVEILKNNQWLFTEKIDGTNLRIWWNGHTLTYGGRTDNANFSKREIEYIETFLVNEYKTVIFEQLFQEKEVMVYGELYGSGIQNGGLYTNGEGYAFRVFDIEIDSIFLTYDNAFAITTQELNYDFVPIVMKSNIQEAVDYVLETDKSTFSEAKLEGLVGKPLGDFRDRLGKRIIVKIKKKDLLKAW